MPELTKENLSIYYDLTPAKDSEFITVLVGKRKSTNTNVDHPPFVVLKQGTGAIADLNATLALQQTHLPGILPVIAAGNDFFIRVAFSDEQATKWSQIRGEAADQIILDAIDLALAMLDKGLIDRDRKVMKTGDDTILLKNLAISEGRLFFFDFDPEHIINWDQALDATNEYYIEFWKTAHNKLIESLASELGLSKQQTDPLMEQFHERAGKIMENKGEQAAKIWQALSATSEVASMGSYKPPLPAALHKTPSERATSIHSKAIEPGDVIIRDIFSLMQNYLSIKKHTTQETQDTVVKIGALIQRCQEEGKVDVYRKLQDMIKGELSIYQKPHAARLVMRVQENLTQEAEQATRRGLS